MIINAIISIIALILCAFLAKLVGRILFGDHNHSRTIRIITSSVFFIFFMAIALVVLDALFGGINIEKELEKDPMFQSLKLKHPNKYKKIIWELELLKRNGKLNENNIVIMSQQKFTPLLNDIVSNAGDQSRHKFTTASIKNIRILKDRDDTACYDAMFNPQATTEKAVLLSEAFNESGLDDAITAAINDSGVDKAVVSEKIMQKTAQKAFQKLGRKYGNDVMLVITPEKAFTKKDKRKVCDILIDFYKYLNDPNDKAKMATLRKALQEGGKIS